MKSLLIISAIMVGFWSGNYYSYIVGKGEKVKMYWKDKSGKPYGNFKAIKEDFTVATNGGMYMPGGIPCGLFIQNGKELRPINKANGRGDFCIMPNGIFYVTNDGISGICKTDNFKSKNVASATQSGPMLVIDGIVSSSINPKSQSRYIRNGVGILKNGETVFAISAIKVTMYEFAEYFKSIGCKNALYLDGGVSMLYPFRYKYNSKFGVIITVTK